jgi:WhiB family redox-sensing transcriptional regulator
VSDALRDRLSAGVDWQLRAACAEGVDPEIFFPERGQSANRARAICATCMVREACLEYALANREEYGIFGGTSAKERRKLARAVA